MRIELPLIVCHHGMRVVEAWVPELSIHGSGATLLPARRRQPLEGVRYGDDPTSSWPARAKNPPPPGGAPAAPPGRPRTPPRQDPRRARGAPPPRPPAGDRAARRDPEPVARR